MPKLKNQRHFAEIMVANTLMRHPNAMELASNFIRDKTIFGDAWPGWCYFPMAATYAILTQGADASRAKDMLSNPEELSILTAAISWSPFKSVYRFDATVANELCTQALDGQIPVQALLHMPEPCVFIEAAVNFVDRHYDGFFAWLENDTGEGTATGMELRLLYVDRQQNAASFPVILRGTIDDSVQALTQSAANRSAFAPTINPAAIADAIRADVAAAINLVLYLCSEEPDINGEHTWRSRPRDATKPLKAAVKWDVGLRVGNAIRRYKNEQAQKEVEEEKIRKRESRAAPRPHIRRAHWHHFWRGPKDGQRELILHWLPPVPVKTEWEQEQPVVIRPTK